MIDVLFEKIMATLTVGGVGIWTIVGLILTALIRQKPITMKLGGDREANLLRERAVEMRGMRKKIRLLEGELRVAGHVVGNLNQSFDALLMMLELNPDKVELAVGKAREMRDRQKLEEAEEKASLIKSRITEGDEDDDDLADEQQRSTGKS